MKEEPSSILFFSVLLIFIAFNSLVNAWVIRSRSGEFKSILWMRFIGTAILSFPLLIFITDQSYLFFHSNHSLVTLILTGIFSLAAILLNRMRRITDKDANIYAYLSKSRIDARFVILETCAFVLYLFFYELLFRGLLLFYCIKNYGVVNAVIVNVSIYALSHIQQGVREAFGALAFGLILCIPTIISGNFWSAYVIHLSLALSNSYFITKRHKGYYEK